MKISQELLIRDHLVRVGSITRIEADHLHRVASLTKVISKLRSKGMDIQSQPKKDITGRRYVRYVYKKQRRTA